MPLPLGPPHVLLTLTLRVIHPLYVPRLCPFTSFYFPSTTLPPLKIQPSPHPTTKQLRLHHEARRPCSHGTAFRSDADDPPRC